jgi:hypothetical protein
MEHATWIKATAPSARTGPDANLTISCTLAGFKPPTCHHCTHNIHCFKALWIFFYVLPAWKHGCMFVGACTLRSRSQDMVHHNCLDSLTARLKQTTALCMIAHLYHDLYQEVLIWFCGLASELELAHSGAVHPANFPMAGPWCQCERQGAAPRTTDTRFTPSK